MTTLERTITASEALAQARDTYRKFEAGRSLLLLIPSLWDQYKAKMFEALQAGDQSTPLARLVEILSGAGYSWDRKAQQWRQQP